ncbi:hypothetical protein RclHR1_05800013 [Rhizophagus clarus]|uniref:Uncharacterized protein n=1 Tax=Rhizophagus clarus TaxID=94130 RepID=A0A2Z6RPC8_9GLOM|nr:hypothetical protein RclHR1_05800013 [Rhizophagus clarus]
MLVGIGIHYDQSLSFYEQETPFFYFLISSLDEANGLDGQEMRRVAGNGRNEFKYSSESSGAYYMHDISAYLLRLL